MAPQGNIVYPFTAMIGQEKMRSGLILLLINPALGGLLIQGEKGTAKSTAVRALSSLMPEVEVVIGYHFSCDPKELNRLCKDCRQQLLRGYDLPATFRPVRVVDLPLSITEERLELARASLRKAPSVSPLLIIITDGKGNISMGEDKPMVEALEIARVIAAESRVKAMVIDVEKVSSISFGVAHLMAGILGATYNKIEDLKAGFLVQAVKKALL